MIDLDIQPTRERIMKYWSLMLVALILVLCANRSSAESNTMQAGSQFHGIRDYRQVMSGVLYRGGANNGHGPLRDDQLSALCEEGIGTAVYLYRTGFHGPSTIHCSRGAMAYIYKNWEGAGRSSVHQAIYNAITKKEKPIFIHCWNGIHATGAVAATALIQFCNVSPEQAVKYWKVGIAPRLQYPKVIRSILDFRPNPNLRLTTQQQIEYCPHY
jgi:hypothetical protein